MLQPPGRRNLLHWDAGQSTKSVAPSPLMPHPVQICQCSLEGRTKEVEEISGQGGGGWWRPGGNRTKLGLSDLERFLLRMRCVMSPMNGTALSPFHPRVAGVLARLYRILLQSCDRLR